MGLKDGGDGTPYGGTQGHSSKDSKKRLKDEKRKLLTVSSPPHMLGQFRMSEANESDEKTEITFLNNLNPEMVASLLNS